MAKSRRTAQRVHRVARQLFQPDDDVTILHSKDGWFCRVNSRQAFFTFDEGLSQFYEKIADWVTVWSGIKIEPSDIATIVRKKGLNR